MRLSIHPDAEQELFEARRYYHSQSRELGSRFSAEFREAVKRISNAPQRYRQLSSGMRRFRLIRFPYLVVYRVEGEDVRVIALSHHRRHPDYWRDRLND